MTDKVELKSCHEVIDTVDVVNIESIFCGKPTDPDILTVIMKDGKRLYCDEVCPMQEEPVSEELEEVANKYGKDTFVNECMENGVCDYYDLAYAFKAGANWQKEHLWKPADGNDMPEYEREVVVLTQPYPLENSEYAVSFAHRPNPNGWNGKSVTTGKVEYYTPKTYDKGSWNIPDVKYWLDVELPNE